MVQTDVSVGEISRQQKFFHSFFNLTLGIIMPYCHQQIQLFKFNGYLHWGVWHESGLVSMWLWFKRYRTRESFILSPQGFKSTIYMAWLRLFRSHFAVYYRGPTLCCFTRPPPLWRRIFFPPIVPLIAWQNHFSHNLITFGQWVAIVPVKIVWSDILSLSPSVC